MVVLLLLNKILSVQSFRSEDGSDTFEIDDVMVLYQISGDFFRNATFFRFWRIQTTDSGRGYYPPIMKSIDPILHNLFSDAIFVIFWSTKGNFLWILKATDYGFNLRLFFND
ncbi:unnamed protein product [Linum trigynum]|uniref:Uncharacterized protein n=1 Tax=Linum trigynum TaxID=586398 RepID=A0AAV2GW87_9ROSI